MTAALLIGLAFGGGVIFLVTGLSPAPIPLANALSELHRRRAVPLMGGTDRLPSTLTKLLGQTWTGSSLGRRLVEPVGVDLRITGTSAAEHLAQRVGYALTGLLWAPLSASIMWAGGVGAGLVLPLWVSIALCPLGFLYPSISLRSKATDRRRTFRHAFSAFLDVVAVSLAGGRGVESALHDGADTGQGWAFDEIRRALLEARLLGEAPWTGLGRLGVDLGVPELGELAASAALAGSEGARVRASLGAKARAIRLRGLTDIEAAAQSASERMSLPIVLLMLGFIVFLGYPAVAKVLQGI
ncbi:MAG: type II secretion system F family protein [Actinomycetota bacterium]|nr:type II secretion system F family protein [Actinomycetota bacterium]